MIVTVWTSPAISIYEDCVVAHRVNNKVPLVDKGRNFPFFCCQDKLFQCTVLTSHRTLFSWPVCYKALYFFLNQEPSWIIFFSLAKTNWLSFMERHFKNCLNLKIMIDWILFFVTFEKILLIKGRHRYWRRAAKLKAVLTALDPWGIFIVQYLTSVCTVSTEWALS